MTSFNQVMIWHVLPSDAMTMPYQVMLWPVLTKWCYNKLYKVMLSFTIIYLELPPNNDNNLLYTMKITINFTYLISLFPKRQVIIIVQQSITSIFNLSPSLSWNLSLIGSFP